jgi:hypothetical protein
LGGTLSSGWNRAQRQTLNELGVHLEKDTDRMAEGPNSLATTARLVWNVSVLAKATGCPEI